MPQIDAPTVAEHRARQEEALLDAAEAILLERGHRALTFDELGRRSGLARSSVYRYFDSRDDVIAALCERDLPGWMAVLERDMAAAADLEGRVAAYVEGQLRMVGSGGHRMATLLGDAPLGPAVRARINALAYRPATLLEAELRAAGDADPEMRAQLLQGLVNAGVRLLHGAADADDVARRSVAMAQALVRTPG